MRRRVTILLSVTLLGAGLVPLGMAGAETREHYPGAFTLRDQAFLAGAGGDAAPASLTAGPSEAVDAGTAKTYRFDVPAGETPGFRVFATYDDRRLPIEGCVQSNDINLVLTDGAGNVVGEDARACDGGDLFGAGTLLGGTYELTVWIDHGASAYDLLLEVNYDAL